jgi:hypothetical protein
MLVKQALLVFAVFTPADDCNVYIFARETASNEMRWTVNV